MKQVTTYFVYHLQNTTPFSRSLSKCKQNCGFKKNQQERSPFSLVLQTAPLRYESPAPTNFYASSIAGGRRKPSTAEGFVVPEADRELEVADPWDSVVATWWRRRRLFFFFGEKLLGFFRSPWTVAAPSFILTLLGFWAGLLQSKGVSSWKSFKVLQLSTLFGVWSGKGNMNPTFFFWICPNSFLGCLLTFTAGKGLFTVVNLLEYLFDVCRRKRRTCEHGFDFFCVDAVVSVEMMKLLVRVTVGLVLLQLLRLLPRPC